MKTITSIFNNGVNRISFGAKFTRVQVFSFFFFSLSLVPAFVPATSGKKNLMY